MKQKSDSSSCCSNSPEYEITYSCGFEPDQTILVCEDHYKKESFQKCIKSLKILECAE